MAPVSNCAEYIGPIRFNFQKHGITFQNGPYYAGPSNASPY